MRNNVAKLVDAAKAGDADVVRRCLERGSSVDEIDGKGRTALMYSAENGDVVMVRLLVNSGASVNKEDESGQTALFTAAKKGHVDAVRVLIELGADNTWMLYECWSSWAQM
uniref:Uncharacterized protein n=1 Tax=Globisporangium ultimum (strain ATCC 200006 / CBS 805.95 / DAOM BR144) TaxID=431595 RepID=K3X1E1_GLOUD